VHAGSSRTIGRRPKIRGNTLRFYPLKTTFDHTTTLRCYNWLIFIALALSGLGSGIDLPRLRWASSSSRRYYVGD
jgi:hypothetical protein